jgi:phosphate transport system substrate-binding protein
VKIRSRHRGGIGLATSGLGLALLAGCASEPAESPTRGHLAIAVAESHAPLIGRTVELFGSLYPGARLSVYATSAREAFIALLADSVRLAVVDRPPNVEEAAAFEAAKLDLERVSIAEDALALVVHPANRLESVSMPEAGRLLGDAAADWRAFPGSGLVGPVELVTTGRNTGSWELLARFFPETGAPRPRRIAPTQHEVLQHVAHNPGALGVISVAAWREPGPRPATVSTSGDPGWANGVQGPANDGVRPLAIVVPDSLGRSVARALHQANVHRGAYPLHYPVAVYFNKRSLLAAGFSAFLASAPAQKRILDAGLVPATMPVRLVQLH